MFPALILFLWLSSTIPTTQTTPTIPGQPEVDVHSVTTIWYKPENCRWSKEAERGPDAKECSHVVVTFGAIRANRSQDASRTRHDSITGADTNDTVSTFVPPASVYSSTVRFFFNPLRCKALQEPRTNGAITTFVETGRFVCGSRRGKYDVWWKPLKTQK